MAHLCLSRQASWLGFHVCLNVVVLNSFFRMFLRVMQWSSHCVPWQIDFVGVLFGLRPLFFFLVYCSGCFAVSSGETQVWLGDLRVVVVWWSCVFFLVFLLRFACSYGPAVSLYKRLFDSLCSCKDRASERHRPNSKEKKVSLVTSVICGQARKYKKTKPWLTR